MANITTGNYAKAMYPGVNAWFGKSYNEFSVEWTALYDSFKSNRNYEEDVFQTSLGLASVKTEGSPVTYDSMRQGWTVRYTHVVYANGFIVTKEAFKDDLYDVVGSRGAQELAFSMRQTKETVASNPYNRAFNSSYTGGDGLELCSTAHVNISGGTWQNELTNAADLSETALEQACIDMSKWQNDRGLKVNITPKSLHIPYDLVFEAERILKTPHRVGTADNDINALYSMGKFPGGIVPNHYFTDTDAWFLRTNAAHGMKHFQREALTFAVDNDFDTNNAKFKAEERYVFGWSDPRGLYGSPGV